MKRTEYFATIEEANQYYPDGVPSSVIAIVGDGSQVLVSSDNAATNTQQYYSADLTNDEIVNTMVQDSYDEGHSDGYAEGVADGQAEGGTNWLDVLYLDEKAKADSFLSETLDFYKYNFAKYATSEPSIEQQSAMAFIYGIQNNSALFKLIKITKDADDNVVITYNPCSINFDGTNLGSFELDSNTYNTKICIWGTLTLAAGDEVIMDCATTITDPESGDVYALGLFGGFDDETNDPATFKCETAGTYTFGIWIDAPQVQNGEAECFVSTSFNYTGSGTVTAITVPTGEPTDGSGEPTDEELDQQAYLFFTQGPGYENTNEVMNYAWGCGTQVSTIDNMDGELYKGYLSNTDTFSNMDAPYNIYITLYDPTQTPEFQWGTYSGYLTPSYNVSADQTTGWPIVTVTFTPSNDCKVGFGLLPIKIDAESGDTGPDPDIASISTFLKPFDAGNYTYRHLVDVEAGKTYTATFSVGESPYGDSVAEFAFTEVVLP